MANSNKKINEINDWEIMMSLIVHWYNPNNNKQYIDHIVLILLSRCHGGPRSTGLCLSARLRARPAQVAALQAKEREREFEGEREGLFVSLVLRRGRDPGCKNEG